MATQNTDGNQIQAVRDARTIQQKIFVGDNILNSKNKEIQKYITESNNMLTNVDSEYKKVKTLLLKYKIIKEQLELNFMKKAKHIKKTFTEIKRRQDDLESKQEKQLAGSDKREKKFKKMQQFIDNVKGPLNQWSTELWKMRNKGAFQEKEVRKAMKKSGLHDQKIEEYWKVINKVDNLMNKLNLTVDEVKGYMSTEQTVSKEVADELGELKQKLITTTEQIGGQNLKKIAKEQNVNDSFIKYISNPIQYKLTKKNMSGGSKVNSHKLWIKDSSSHIFKKFTRNELNNIAKNWGIKNPYKFKNKQSLSNALKTLMLYKGGYINKRQHCNTVCKNIDSNPKQFNNIKQIKSYLNKELTRVII